MISDANSNLQNLDLLLDSHYHPGQRDDIKARQMDIKAMQRESMGMSVEDDRSQRLKNQFKMVL